MKSSVKYILVFLAGAGVGVGSTYIYWKQHFEKISNDAIDQVKDRARRRTDFADSLARERMEAVAPTYGENDIPKPPEGFPKTPEEAWKRPADQSISYTDYCAYFKGEDTLGNPLNGDSKIRYVEGLDEKLAQTYEENKDTDDATGFSEAMAGYEYPRDDEPEDDEDEDEENSASIIDTDYETLIEDEVYETRREEDHRPYPISYADMSNQRQWYDKLSFNYYEDGTLTDDQDQPVSPAEYVFPGWEKLFGTNSEDPDVIYVRNPDKGMDYEICRIEESYSDNHVIGD